MWPVFSMVWGDEQGELTMQAPRWLRRLECNVTGHRYEWTVARVGDFDVHTGACRYCGSGRIFSFPVNRSPTVRVLRIVEVPNPDAAEGG